MRHALRSLAYLCRLPSPVSFPVRLQEWVVQQSPQLATAETLYRPHHDGGCQQHRPAAAAHQQHAPHVQSAGSQGPSRLAQPASSHLRAHFSLSVGSCVLQVCKAHHLTQRTRGVQTDRNHRPVRVYRPNWTLVLHHVGTVATLCLVIFAIFDTGALQPMLLMTHTFLAFETLEVVATCRHCSQGRW